MTRRARSLLFLVALALLYLLHNDFWLWDEGRLVFGLPAGLAYHVGYCLAAALLMWVGLRWAWPPSRGGDAGESAER